MKLRNILTNPYLLSFIPFIIIILLFPIKVSRYDLKLEGMNVLEKNHIIFYEDLDNDSISEKMLFFDSFNSSGLTIRNDSGILDQWNLHGNFSFGLKRPFIAGDKDGDGKKEIYLFTFSDDSIYLHCISDIFSPSMLFRNRFITTFGKGIKNPDPFIIPAEMDDLDDDGTKELIFGIGSGLSHSPRGVFAYYINKDSLVKSEESSYFIQSIYQADVTGDGKKEIIPAGYAAGNIGPDVAKYHDHSSFLIVLDRNMRFLFKPLEFKGKFSQAYPFVTADKDKPITLIYSSPNSRMGSTRFNIGSDGTIKDSVKIDFYATSPIRNDDEYLSYAYNRGFVLHDQNFRIIREVTHRYNGTFMSIDADADGRKEYLLYFPENKSLSIYRKGLKSPASVTVELSSMLRSEPVTVKLNKDNAPLLSVQAGQNHYELLYSKNKHFYYSYFYYILIYLSILGFAFTIRHFQRDQMRKRYENEKKISELQLALIRNQLDPHFTLNAINSIIYSVDYGDRNQAAERLRCFAALYRDLVLSAGSSRRSIEEEINFCENYLELEKMRFEDKFNYEINIAEEVNLNMQIPKFLIQIHAENALKHGLAPLESGGFLRIELKNTESGLQIEIQDNGVGRKTASLNKGQSTGKGLEIMNELYSLYNKYYSEKIESLIADLHDNNGKASGTRITINIKKSEAVPA